MIKLDDDSDEEDLQSSKRKDNVNKVFEESINPLENTPVSNRPLNSFNESMNMTSKNDLMSMKTQNENVNFSSELDKKTSKN